MSYELWCYKDRSTTPNPYVLLDVNSETSSAVSATIQDAFATFGIGSVSIPSLEALEQDYPELFI